MRLPNAGLALPYAPYWWGVTIGGMLGTGAHGSTLWGKGSAVHDYVVEIRIVSPGGPKEGYAKVRILDDDDEEFHAAKVSFGVLGVISQVTIKLQPLFKRSITYLTKNDSDLGDQVESFGQEHEFGDITWYPSQRTAVYRIDDRVATNTCGNGLYDFTPFRSTLSAEVGVVRSLEEFQESVRDANGKCLAAKFVISTLMNGAYGLRNDVRNKKFADFGLIGHTFTGYPVIGYQNRLQPSGTCLDSPEDALSTACAWDPRIKGEFFHETTFSIGLSKSKSFIQDVQKLIELKPKSMLYEDILEEVEQLALFKYGALPHWGKNRNLAFDGAINKYRNAKEFSKIKDVYDPLGLFSSEWTNEVLGLQNGLTVDKKGCALEGLCICSLDIHCAPSAGYYCRPGKVYKDARVCTRLTS
ncbi:L-gulonolactone oxidase [Morella rubra]|uniref:L-gulonolactone oxidase n=1 Tax=Morella rubra TaxID=262757 RepID=A0A6A1VN65_9ROSI|nr:L-gulonolactone oxidase [Morella rubra]